MGICNFQDQILIVQLSIRVRFYIEGGSSTLTQGGVGVAGLSPPGAISRSWGGKALKIPQAWLFQERAQGGGLH